MRKAASNGNENDVEATHHHHTNPLLELKLPKCIIIDAQSINHIDIMGINVVLEADKELRSVGIQLLLAAVLRKCLIECKRRRGEFFQRKYVKRYTFHKSLQAPSI